MKVINWMAHRSMEIVFACLLLVAFILSGWSLATLAIGFGMPKWLAVVVSLSIDGASLYLGNLVFKYAAVGDSSGAAKFWCLALALASMALNAEHARLLHLGLTGMGLFALPSLVVYVLFEATVRFVGRELLRKRGHVNDPLPALGVMSYLMFPVKSFKGIRRIGAHRLEVKLQGSLKPIVIPTQLEAGDGSIEKRECRSCGAVKYIEEFPVTAHRKNEAKPRRSTVCQECIA